jgi:benzoylformate decarboxylase
VLNLNNYRSERGSSASRPQPDSFDLSHPAIDFVKLAEAQGVSGCRVTVAADLKIAFRTMLTHSGPFLVDTVVA